MECIYSVPVDLGEGDFEYSSMTCTDPYSVVLTAQHDTITTGFYVVVFFIVLISVIIIFKR
jgi:hypothetical protein